MFVTPEIHSQEHVPNSGREGHKSEDAARLASGVPTEAVLQADIANADRTLTVIVALVHLA